MKKILVATDFSERSDLAIRRATRLARQLKASLAVVHVIDDDQPRRIVDAEQRHAARDLSRFVSSVGLEGTRQVVRYEEAAAQHEILKTAKTEKADLVVLSTHGKTGVAKLLLGSVTEHVLKSATIDVLAIPLVHDTSEK